MRKIRILGDGGWGTTLAIHLAKKGFSVTLWGPFPENISRMKRLRRNPKFLPGFKIPSTVMLTSEMAQAMAFGQLVVLAVPSQYVTGVLDKIKSLPYKNKTFLSVIKGIEPQTLKRISQIIVEKLGKVQLAVLSGPTIAAEVAREIPTTAVIAAGSRKLALKLQSIFHSPTFRIYTNSDVIGTELGGSVKNIIALACGVCDGLGLGTNAKAALVTRGLAEMARLGVAMGARKETFSGLTGLGDLVTTCFNPQSRNRSVGEELGKGRSIKNILGSMDMVAEGVITTQAVYRLSRKLGVSMPITGEMFKILYQGKKSKNALGDLMTRSVKSE